MAMDGEFLCKCNGCFVFLPPAEVFKINHKACILHGRMKDGVLTFVDMQDWLHCQKKLYNPSYMIGRTLLLGNGYVCHQNLMLLCSLFERGAFDLGVGVNDLEVKDRQNWARVVRCSSSLVQKAYLEKANSEPLHKDNFIATHFFLKMVHRYGLIFGGLDMPLSQRISYCGYVMEFNARWYKWLITKKSMNVSVADSFLTLNAWRDSHLSMESFLLMVKYSLVVCETPEEFDLLRKSFAKFNSDCSV
jgi:hypothetical protein